MVSSRTTRGRGTGFCITLDRIREACGVKFLEESVLPVVTGNDSQLQEWTQLLGVEDGASIDKNLDQKLPCPPLPLDTRYFPEEFEKVLLKELTGKSSRQRPLLDGYIVHGENERVLQQILPQLRRQVQTIYIDPPYNTGGKGSGLAFGYEDDFTHESWIAMMRPRLKLAREVLVDDGTLFISIDDNERPRLELLLQDIFGEEAQFGPVIVQVNKGGRDYLPVAKTHEYVLCTGTGRAPPAVGKVPKDAEALAQYRFTDKRGRFLVRELRNRNPKFHADNRPNLHYPVYAAPDLVDADGFCPVSLEATAQHTIVIRPVNSNGRADAWRWGKEKLAGAIESTDPGASKVVARQRRDGGWNLYEKYRKTTTKAKSIWTDAAMRTEAGTILLRHLFGNSSIHAFPKPLALVEQCVVLGTPKQEGFDAYSSENSNTAFFLDSSFPLRRPLVLDFFAGTGTTAHAVISANQRDWMNRQFLLVEQADYVESVTIPRLKKIAYASDWQAGKPRDSTSLGPGIFLFVTRLSDC